jgi:radical SAM/Cys-rich protein
MSRATAETLLEVLETKHFANLDLTGGAPELNPNFHYLVEQARRLDVHIIDRCNLTVLEEEEQSGLAEFLAQQGVEIVASLPCYLEENVDTQRGKGSYETSMTALRRLNQLGYGISGSGLTLNLVYNPLGPYLPPPQAQLEADYKKQLFERYGIVFNQLLTITNMPINRFGSFLQSKGEFHSYLQLLRDAYQEANLDAVMCRSLVSVDWRGYLYDCDFNQMLDMPIRKSGRRLHLQDLKRDALKGAPIQVADHCYGCTAGQGSSCGGALD